jgi:hypothetical protein
LFQEFWENKRRQDEERDKLEALKNKDKNEQSAIASSEVKQKLQGFLLNKKQREAAAMGSGVNFSASPGPGGMGSPGMEKAIYLLLAYICQFFVI